MVNCFTYVHDKDSRGVKFLDNPFGRNSDGGHEKSGLLLHVRNEVISVVSEPRHTGHVWTHLDDYIDQFRKLSLLVIVLGSHEAHNSQPRAQLSGLICPCGWK